MQFAANHIRVTDTSIYHEITVTRLKHPMLPSTKSVLDPNLFRPVQCLKDELPAEAWLHDAVSLPLVAKVH